MADETPWDLAAKEVRFFHPREWHSKHHLGEPYPVEFLTERWVPLAKTLDVIREKVGGPVRITPNGGYRNEAHNEYVGGVAKSQHVQGRAADLWTAKMSADDLHDLILDLYNEGLLPGLSGLGAYPTFTHVDVGANDGLVRRWDKSLRQTP